MKQGILNIILFLFLNFLALGLGAYFTGDGVISEWYQTLNKAPWTPPGWVFGAAWTTIMTLFAIYMAALIQDKKEIFLITILYGIQWILNFSWNPIFFKFHLLPLSVVVIISLTVLVCYFLIRFKSRLQKKSFLILPYLIWMLIASSLNIYAYLNN